MDKFPDVVEAVINEGHIIGYHSYSHDSLKKINFKKILADFKKAKYLMQRFRIKIKLYRPPFGDLTLFSFLFLAFPQWKIIMWSVDSGDSFYEIDKIIGKVHPSELVKGDIILFHDDYEKTVEILPEILNQIIYHKISCKVLTV